MLTTVEGRSKEQNPQHINDTKLLNLPTLLKTSTLLKLNLPTLLKQLHQNILLIQ